jgi:hypothetical protein
VGPRMMLSIVSANEEGCGAFPAASEPLVEIERRHAVASVKQRRCVMVSSV